MNTGILACGALHPLTRAWDLRLTAKDLVWTGLTAVQLVSEFLRQLSIQDDLLADAPVVRRLSGTLSPDASIEEYRKYLEKKHGS